MVCEQTHDSVYLFFWMKYWLTVSIICAIVCVMCWYTVWTTHWINYRNIHYCMYIVSYNDLYFDLLCCICIVQCIINIIINRYHSIVQLYQYLVFISIIFDGSLNCDWYLIVFMQSQTNVFSILFVFKGCIYYIYV